MSETKFTPGPWVIEGDRDEDFGLSIWKGEGPICHIAFTTGYASEDEANARLIAAAPDLYAAAEELKAAFMDGCGRSRPGSAKRRRLQAAGAALDAACAKARGETA